MANNRMYLVCCTCNQTGSADSGMQMVAKYFPSEGWHSSDEWIHENGLKVMSEKLNRFFELHRHGDHSDEGVRNKFRIAYDTDLV